MCCSDRNPLDLVERNFILPPIVSEEKEGQGAQNLHRRVSRGWLKLLRAEDHECLTGLIGELVTFISDAGVPIGINVDYAVT
jgi:hypothetical protein